MDKDTKIVGEQYCPKCAVFGWFDVRYIRNGYVPFPDQGEWGVTIDSAQMAVGPCLMKSCRTCGYTYTITPADGEGAKDGLKPHIPARSGGYQRTEKKDASSTKDGDNSTEEHREPGSGKSGNVPTGRIYLSRDNG